MLRKRASEEIFLQGAIRTAAEVGIENLRTKNVAKLAGFSESAMYKIFPTKEVLLRDTFLHIDRKISDLLIQNTLDRSADSLPFEMRARSIWRKVYRYLIEHREETLFLIRYRYSSLYTDEVRNRREAYNGNMDKVYAMFEHELGKTPGMSWQFLINSVFELTLCFAEKVITGRLEDTEDTEGSVWNIVENSIEGIKKKAG